MQYPPSLIPPSRFCSFGRASSLTFLLSAFLVAGAACSDDSSDGGDGGSGGSATTNAGSGGTGMAGSAMTGGGSGGTAVAGSAGMAGTGGTDMATGDNFPTPDKLVALTFDDGPNVELTGAMLDKLEEHDVTASFFVIGQLMTADKQAVVDRALAMGCTFENHSNDYVNMGGLTAEQMTASVDATTAAIEALTNDPPVFFRPPNLNTSPLLYETIDLPFAVGILGNDYPNGEGGANPTVETISQRIINGVQDGQIILLHDVQPGLPDPLVTSKALDVIIPDLKMQGYEFVNLRELFDRRGVDPTERQDSNWDVVPPQ